jgi:hypothetical protein
MMPRNRVPLVVMVLKAFLIWAEKDGDYYQPGLMNPNTQNAMYWKDSKKILEDLSQFEALYISYHNCVWSKYGSRYLSAEGENDQQAEGDEANAAGSNNLGCNGMGSDHFWYMGQTQCFKANAAYSLYGILKGEEIPKNPCSKTTFINSFFTTFGVESFSGPLGIDISTVNSQCTAQNANGGNQGQDQEFQVDDDYLANNYEFQDYRAYTSYGTGCSASGDFAIEVYQGAFCHGTKRVQTTDTLNDFNAKIKEFECTQIYDASSSGTENEYVQANNNAYDFENMDAINILSVSESCSLRQYPHDCPDPFGIKKLYDKAMQKSFYQYSASQRDKIIDIINTSSIAALAGGILFLVAAYFTKRTRDRSSKVRKQLRKEKKAEKDAKRNSKQERKKIKKVEELQQIEDGEVTKSAVTANTNTIATSKEQNESTVKKIPLFSRLRRKRQNTRDLSPEKEENDKEEPCVIIVEPIIESIPNATTPIYEQDAQCFSLPENMNPCAFRDGEASETCEVGKMSKYYEL